ncbi:hypothetical protein BV22DRAFT_265797 [Leucogyrophana mollusca]|uniref:Uncharacterized protein n=1 Tax=Leucogyrophana mollusca TaxID=85980 RepID=A0ACB8BSI9_9AGAM|nr:hypothetical protein BV22DRAFT_265797 [Leucogyrophana mollusca]
MGVTVGKPRNLKVPRGRISHAASVVGDNALVFPSTRANELTIPVVCVAPSEVASLDRPFVRWRKSLLILIFFTSIPTAYRTLQSLISVPRIQRTPPFLDSVQTIFLCLYLIISLLNPFSSSRLSRIMLLFYLMSSIGTEIPSPPRWSVLPNN